MIFIIAVFTCEFICKWFYYVIVYNFDHFYVEIYIL